MVNVNNTFVANPPIDGGVLFSMALGAAALPTDAKAELPAPLKDNDHGAVGENGNRGPAQPHHAGHQDV
ncbi:hypothetical protein GS928_25295, partial [Rhodococcus hoagii]|nr:hypothetical protein [Prescottella equi]